MVVKVQAEQLSHSHGHGSAARLGGCPCPGFGPGTVLPVSSLPTAPTWLPALLSLSKTTPKQAHGSSSTLPEPFTALEH